jgi:crossover junction endodeoxyribonuclease RusA
MILTLPYPPSANRYWRVWRGRAVKSDEARAYQAKVGLLARVQGATGEPMLDDIELKISVYRPAKRGDLDNCLKVAIDALKGVVFVDDSQVVRIEAERADDKANPRIVIQVRRAA